MPDGKTQVLLVIDQLERWLLTWTGQQDDDMIVAFEQLRRPYVQAIAVVRDSVPKRARLLAEYLESQFSQAPHLHFMDLFDPEHARRVLTKFGEVYKQLPSGKEESNAFVKEAVESLTKEGHVLPASLSHFAWVLREKPWVLSTLEEVGGPDGVMSTLLDDILATEGILEYQQDRKAAQAILRALAPNSEIEFCKSIRSWHELSGISGYDLQVERLKKLLSILETKLCLLSEVEDPNTVVPYSDRGDYTAYKVLSSVPRAHCSSIEEWAG